MGNGGKIRGLTAPPDLVRCVSTDTKHEWLRCMKQRGHPLNWHECSNGESWHTWVDPAMRARAHVGRVTVTAELPDTIASLR